MPGNKRQLPQLLLSLLLSLSCWELAGLCAGLGVPGIQLLAPTLEAWLSRWVFALDGLLVISALPMSTSDPLWGDGKGLACHYSPGLAPRAALSSSLTSALYSSTQEGLPRC